MEMMVGDGKLLQTTLVDGEKVGGWSTNNAPPLHGTNPLQYIPMKRSYNYLAIDDLFDCTLIRQLLVSPLPLSQLSLSVIVSAAAHASAAAGVSPKGTGDSTYSTDADHAMIDRSSRLHPWVDDGGPRRRMAAWREEDRTLLWWGNGERSQGSRGQEIQRGT